MESVLKDAALGYAARGWPVFPCHWMNGDRCSCGKDKCSAAKHPLTANGFKDATTDPAQIARWWAQCPAANVGVVTGAGSGVWVLDLDGPEAFAALAEFEQQHGPLPVTVTAKTGRGEHRYFACDDAHPVPTSKPFAKADVKGEGGYVIAPPSNHQSGVRYEWIHPPGQTAVAPAPDLLLARLRDGRKPSAPPAAVDPFGECVEYDLSNHPGVAEGGRHNTATRLIGRELARGTSPFEVLALANEWADRCNPPMPRDEVFDTVRSLAAKEACKLEEAIAAAPRTVAWPTLEEEAFYGLAGEIVRAIEPNTEADPAGVLVQLLALFGTAVGRGPYVPVGPAKQHANLFVTLVGESSTGKKGTALKDAMAPFGDTLRPLIGSGLSSGEGLIARVTDAVYKKEPIRNKDKTIDRYQDVIETPAVEDKRLIVIETEFGIVLQVIRREGNTASELVRNAWDDGNLSTMTKVPRKATNAHVSVIGHITPQELRCLLTDTDVFNGFANRFLWVGVKGTRVLPWPKPHDLLDGPARLAEAIRLAQTRTALGRDDAAERLWGELCHGELNRSYPGRLDTLMGRARPQVIRLSLISALLDGSAVIRAEHVRAAMAVWRFCMESARLIFGDSTGDQLADRLLVAIRERPRTTTELYGVLGRHVLREQLQAALNSLVRAGLVRSVPIPGKGRPGQRWIAV